MSAAGPAELEIKLRLAPADAAALLRHPALVALKRARAHTALLRSTYFDTDARRLADAGVGLRIRRAGARWTQTVKGPQDARSGGGLAARPEYEWPLRAGTTMPPLDRALLDDTPWKKPLRKALRDGVRPQFVTAIARTTVPLAFADSTMAMLCLDVGEIRASGDGGKVRICEVELELESGHVHNLFELARALAADLDLAPETASKAARGYALVARTRPAPLRAEDAALPAKAPTAEALAAIVRSCLRQIEGNADGVANARDPEWVHQMRIGTRRLRAALSLMRDVAPAGMLAPLIEETRWLAQKLGAARDLDVLATETLPAIAAAIRTAGESAATAALRSLRAKVARRRHVADAEARAAVASRRYVALVLAVGAFAARPRFGAEPGSPADEILGLRARDFARPLLTHRARKLAKRGRDLPAAPPAERHVARLAAKRLRYATAFFALLFPRKRARAYQDALARLQDVLGALNDAAVAANLAAAVAGPDAPATTTLQGWAAAQTALRADELAKSWRNFTAAQPFWRGD